MAKVLVVQSCATPSCCCCQGRKVGPIQQYYNLIYKLTLSCYLQVTILQHLFVNSQGQEITEDGGIKVVVKSEVASDIASANNSKTESGNEDKVETPVSIHRQVIQIVSGSTSDINNATDDENAIDSIDKNFQSYDLDSLEVAVAENASGKDASKSQSHRKISDTLNNPEIALFDRAMVARRQIIICNEFQKKNFVVVVNTKNNIEIESNAQFLLKVS